MGIIEFLIWYVENQSKNPIIKIETIPKPPSMTYLIRGDKRIKYTRNNYTNKRIITI